jgi:hypothetical protein
MNIWQTLKNWFKKRRIENERNPESFEDSLEGFLNILFIKEEILKDELKKKLALSEESLEFLRNFSLRKGYIAERFINKSKSESYLSITNSGIDFLFNYKKIRAQEKSNITTKWATVVMALMTVLTFYLSFIATAPQVVYSDDYRCPYYFNYYEGYSSIVSIPIVNLGKIQSQTYLELLGNNTYGNPIKNNFIISSSSSSYLSYNVTIQNSSLNESFFYFKINYQKPFNLMGISYTKFCFYEKDKYNNFKLKEN